MPQAAANAITASMSVEEALFLRCILQCQIDFGSKPSAELSLPRSIATVVDYDYVKRMMFTMMLCDGDNTPDSLSKHRESVKKAIKCAREKLMHLKVVGCHDPFVWWTSKPVRGIKETQKQQTTSFDGPMLVSA